MDEIYLSFATELKSHRACLFSPSTGFLSPAEVDRERAWAYRFPARGLDTRPARLATSFNMINPSEASPPRASMLSLRNASAKVLACFVLRWDGSGTRTRERSPGSTLSNPPAYSL